MRIELYRKGLGFLPACEGGLRVLHRLTQGEILWVRTVKVRDPVAHRRYWALMTLCAQNCERLELPYGGVMLIHNKDDIHTAIKFFTGHCDWILDTNGKPVFAIPKSTDFESMDAEDWAEYWPKVVQVVVDKVLPGVQWPEVELEIQKCMRIAA